MAESLSDRSTSRQSTRFGSQADRGACSSRTARSSCHCSISLGAECALDDLIDVMGRASIEAVLGMSSRGDHRDYDSRAEVRRYPALRKGVSPSRSERSSSTNPGFVDAIRKREGSRVEIQQRPRQEIIRSAQHA